MSVQNLQPTEYLIPLLSDLETDRRFAYYKNNKIATVDMFLADVQCAIPQLLDCQYVVNTCLNRYHFTVGFAAALYSGKTTLLPPSGARNAIDEILTSYSDSFLLSDVSTVEHPSPDVLLDTVTFVSSGKSNPCNPNNDLLINASQCAAVLFTSGSTGKPTAHEMTWQKLSCAARVLNRELNKRVPETSPIIATVPPQHMFGLETSVILPMQSKRPIYVPRTFYPADVEVALKTSKPKGMLVTTPTHMRLLARANIKYPAAQFVLSATAPLNTDLAASCEKEFQCRVEEIYGSSETGAIAMRHTTSEESWKLMEGVELNSYEKGIGVKTPGLSSEVALTDLVDITDSRHFKLIGRGKDVIKIAGKRQSLSNINMLIQSLNGVTDAEVFFPPSSDTEEEQGTTRLAALIAGEEGLRQSIIDNLSHNLDPVFMPRPIYFVEELPRNETGKIPVLALCELWNSLRENS